MKSKKYILAFLVFFALGLGLGCIYGRKSQAPQDTVTNASMEDDAQEDSRILTMDDFPEDVSLPDQKEIEAHDLNETLAALQDIRVLLLSDGFAKNVHEKVSLRSSVAIRMEIETENGEIREEFLQAGQTYSIDKLGNSEMGDVKWTFRPEEGEGIELLSLKRNQGHPVYQGTLEIYKDEDGYCIINELPVEQYLYGVVPSEMPASYPMEALKAQAICARTYAYCQMIYGEKLRHDAHVNDSTSYQVYQNIAQQQTTNQAVDETKGMILLNEEGNGLITAFYYATSCGVGTDERIWSTAEDAIPTIPGKIIDHASIRRILEASPEERDILQTAASMTIDQFTERLNGIWTEDFEYEEPWYRWSYEAEKVDVKAFRKRLVELQEQKAQLVLKLQPDGSFQPSEVSKFGKIEGLCIVKRGSGGVAHELLIETDQGSYKVLTENYIRKVLCEGTIKVTRGDGVSVECKSLLPSGFFTMEFVSDKNTIGYKLKGGGLGHGVGMSQNGAKVMAAEGYTAQEILQFFYGGCLFEKSVSKD